MKISKKDIITYAVAIAAGIILGLWMAHCSRQPVETKVERDTVTIHDTNPDYHPMPKDSAHVKWVTRWLPAMWPRQSRDTGNLENHIADAGIMVHDTVAVQVPITSKRYSGKNYDAYVSGFEPSLDSIFVYNETRLITETITKSKPPNKWELDIVGGIDYNTAQRAYTPHACGELLYKPNRLQVGLRGGIEYRDKVEPVIGAVAKIRIF